MRGKSLLRASVLSAATRLGSRTQLRAAHAARLPSENDDDRAEPCPSRLHSSSYTKRSVKGKEREVPCDYCFPAKGRRGGPPGPYEVLALDRSASEGEIKKQYYRLAMILHPDSSHPSSSPEHFAVLHRAYAILSQQQSREAYLQTGYGWSPTGEIRRDSWSDAQMRTEVFARRKGGAAAWEAGSRRYRNSERGGAGAGWQYQEQWQYGDEMAHPPQGNGEARYMSNSRFMSIFLAVGVVVAWIQYQRIGFASSSHRELLHSQHIGAAQALAEARQDAVLHGKERRERIRRRVREMQVIDEAERRAAEAVTDPPA